MPALDPITTQPDTPAPAYTPASASAPAPASAPGSGAATPRAPGMSDESIAELVSAFEAHDFGADTEFRAGLPAVIKAIKGKGSTAAHIDEVIARAQWFYFTRRQQASVPFETYLRCRSRETESQPMKSPTASTSPVALPSVPLGSMGSGPSRTATATAPSASAGVSVSPAAASSPSPTTVTVTPVSAEQPPPHPSAAVSAAEVRVAEAASVAGEPVAAAASTPAPAHPATPTEDMKFSDIVRLIAEGRADEVPVPTIPDGINDEPASVSTMSARPKPWERAAAAEAAADGQDAQGQGQGQEQAAASAE